MSWSYCTQTGRGTEPECHENQDETEGDMRGSCSSRKMESLVSGLLDEVRESHASTTCTKVDRKIDEFEMNCLNLWGRDVLGGSQMYDQSNTRCLQHVPLAHSVTPYCTDPTLNAKESGKYAPILQSCVSTKDADVNMMSLFSDSHPYHDHHLACNGHIVMRNTLEHVGELEVRKAREYAAKLQLQTDRETIILRTTQERAAEAICDKEELQKYKVLTADLQSVTDSLMTEKQVSAKQNMEVVNLCMQLYNHNCGLQKEIVAYKKALSDVMTLRHADHRTQELSMEEPSLRPFRDGRLTRSIGQTFPSSEAADFNGPAYPASSTSSYNSSEVRSASVLPSNGQLRVNPFCHINSVQIPGRRLGGRRRHNRSPNRISSPRHNGSFSAWTVTVAGRPEAETNYATATDPRTPTSVFAFPGTSPPTLTKSSDNENRDATSGVNKKALPEVFESSKSERQSASPVPVAVRASDIKLTSKTPTRLDDNSGIEALIARGMKSISIVQKEKATSRKSSYKSPSSSHANLQSVSGSMPPIRQHRLGMSSEEVMKLRPIDQNAVSAQGELKTEVCNNWNAKGSCSYGQHCRFAHGKEELKYTIRHPRYKSTRCRMDLEGKPCIYGHRCHFAHGHEIHNSMIVEVPSLDLISGSST